jgi:long-chain acyl-CoA synthetase
LIEADTLTHQLFLKKNKNMSPLDDSKSHLSLFILSPFVFAIWILDTIFWLMTVVGPLNAFYKAVFSSPLVSEVTEENPGEGIRISRKHKTSYPLKHYENLYELLDAAFTRYDGMKALGTDNYGNVVSWSSFSELRESAIAFGLGLRKLGMQPLPLSAARACTDRGFKLPDNRHTLLIFHDSGGNWMTAAIGAMSQSMPLITLHASLPVLSVAAVIKETHSPAVLCHRDDVARVRSLALSCPSLAFIIYTNGGFNKEDISSTFRVGGRSIVVLSIEEVIASGNTKYHDSEGNLVESSSCRPTSESLCLVTFTSGATGNPKGVMIRHTSIVASVTSFVEALGLSYDNDTSTNQEVYLAHQPPARVVEFAIEMAMLSSGAAIGFAGVPTLCVASFQKFKPTLVCSTPKDFEALVKGATEEMKHDSLMGRSVFSIAFAARRLCQGRLAPISTMMMRSRQEILGGHIKFCISSGGALDQDIQTTLQVAFGAPTLQLYGLTETCGAGALQLRESSTVGNVGPPMPDIEIKLGSCLDELGEALALDASGRPYLTSDRYHLGIPCLGRGQIAIRGGMVATAYYSVQSNPVLSESKIAQWNGWCLTGDVGVWTSKGELMIVDRLKNLVKLKSGECVALESMECSFNRSAFVNRGNGGVLCYADDKMDQPVALVQVFISLARFHLLVRIITIAFLTFSLAKLIHCFVLFPLKIPCLIL